MNHLSKLPQLACIWLVARCIEYSVHKFMNRSLIQIDKKKKNRIIYPHTVQKTLQTCTWRFSDLPNSMLFDFSKTNSKIDDIKSIIEDNIPSKHQLEWVQKSSSVIELSIDNTGDRVTKQLISILQHKGLYIEKENLWLTPTLTISRHLQQTFFYWKAVIYDLSIKDVEDEYFVKTQLQETLKDTFKRRNNGNDVLIIDATQIYFEKYDQKKILAHLLIQELKDNAQSIIHPSNSLIYVPFLNRHMPIKFNVVV